MGKEKTLGETLLELPLYNKKITFSKKDGSGISKKFIDLLYEKGLSDTIYSYCSGCEDSNTFKIKNITLKDVWESFDESALEQYINGPIMFSYECAGCKNLITIVLRVDGYFEVSHDKFNDDDPPTDDDYYLISDKADYFSYDVVKIGQYPSIADLEKSTIDDYKKILPNDRIKEYKKALGLVSHGVATGAMAYLRRVFEHLLEEAHQEAICNNSNFDTDTGYVAKRVHEKIELLRLHIPQFMYDQRNTIYGIVSKGIHELSEEENLNNFKIVNDAIELILSENLKKYLDEKKKKETEKALQEAIKRIKT